ncbi:MAG: hypothetical protein ACREK6_00140 [Candidatus Rokuibacteriota bacterium]
MSEWITHFVHHRNPDNDPDWIFGQGESVRFPYVFDDEKNDRFSWWYHSDDNYPIEPDGRAIQVLRKIIDDGHIRSTWAFRNGKPTVYGPRAAVCFTEMPLYALMEYAKRRADASSVTAYGIALLKRDAFAFGARPVIYGLTGRHEEVRDHRSQPEDAVRGWPRILTPDRGLAEHEQYRYVSFNLGPGRYSDWTHEREWRWCDSEDRYACPGLPLYLHVAPDLSNVLIFVPTTQEARTILDRLKAQYDSGCEPSGDELHLTNLLNTRVIALEECPEEGVLRIENIPMHSLTPIQIPEPSDDLIAKVKRVLRDIEQAAQAGADAAYDAALKDKEGHVLDACGFASLMISEPQSELTAALLKLGAIEPLGRLGYMFTGLTYQVKSQGLCLEEAAMEAARTEFRKTFPKARLWIHTRLD